MSGVNPGDLVSHTTTPGGLTVHSTPALDAAVGAARDLASLVAFLEKTDPEFAARVANWLVSKSLLGSKTIWMPPLLGGLTWLAGHFLPAGLLDSTSIGLFALALAFGAMVAGRIVARFPITCFFPASWTNGSPVAVPKLPPPAA